MQSVRRIFVAVAGFDKPGHNIVDMVRTIETRLSENQEVVHDYMGFLDEGRSVVVSSSPQAELLNINDLKYCAADDGAFLTNAARGKASVHLPHLMQQVFKINAAAAYTTMPAIDTMLVFGRSIDDGPQGAAQKVSHKLFHDLGLRSLFFIGLDHTRFLAANVAMATQYAQIRHVAASLGATCVPYYERWDHDMATVGGFFAADRLAELDPLELRGGPASRLLAQLVPGHVSVRRLQEVCGIKRVIHSPANIAATVSGPRRSAKLGFPHGLETRDQPSR